MLLQSIRTETAAPAAPALSTLNAVAISAAQLAAALTAVDQLPAHVHDDPIAHATVLEAYAHVAGQNEDAPLFAAALGARLAALAGWIAKHEPDRRWNAQGVIEAAARFPLSAGDDGIAFDPPGFQEMILFIEELSW